MSRIKTPRFGNIRPLSKPFPPPQIVLGDWVKLRQIIGNKARFRHLLVDSIVMTWRIVGILTQPQLLLGKAQTKRYQLFQFVYLLRSSVQGFKNRCHGDRLTFCS